MSDLGLNASPHTPLSDSSRSKEGSCPPPGSPGPTPPPLFFLVAPLLSLPWLLAVWTVTQHTSAEACLLGCRGCFLVPQPDPRPQAHPAPRRMALRQKHVGRGQCVLIPSSDRACECWLLFETVLSCCQVVGALSHVHSRSFPWCWFQVPFL